MRDSFLFKMEKLEPRPELETVLQTLHALYKASPNDVSSQSAANEWLMDLQKSVMRDWERNIVLFSFSPLGVCLGYI